MGIRIEMEFEDVEAMCNAFDRMVARCFRTVLSPTAPQVAEVVTTPVAQTIEVVAEAPQAEQAPVEPKPADATKRPRGRPRKEATETPVAQATETPKVDEAPVAQATETPQVAAAPTTLTLAEVRSACIQARDTFGVAPVQDLMRTKFGTEILAQLDEARWPELMESLAAMTKPEPTTSLSQDFDAIFAGGE